MQVDDNLNLLVMGTVAGRRRLPLLGERAPGLGDEPPSLREDEAILLDTQAGVEHFGRALAEGFSQCLVVTDTSFVALAVARYAAELARQSGIKHIQLVVNRRKEDGSRKLTELLDLTGTDLAALFDGVHSLPLEPRFDELEPNVTRICRKKVPTSPASTRWLKKCWFLRTAADLFRNKENPMKKIFVDYKKCVACKGCELACAIQQHPSHSLYALVGDKKTQVNVRVLGVEHEAFPVSCRHCDPAMCLDACPSGAISRDPKTSAVVLNPDLCKACAMCAMVCPFDAVSFKQTHRARYGRTVAYKCDLCHERLQEGLNPACVDACHSKALCSRNRRN
ncbi:MAG: 4Fe-4S dicluster domain-containing protein [Syntrophotaleaceae bacterium]